jgi:hypothetical protein
LLATDLTDLERQYLHKRIAEEQAELERIEMQELQDEGGLAYGHRRAIAGGKPSSSGPPASTD